MAFSKEGKVLNILSYIYRCCLLRIPWMMDCLILKNKVTEVFRYKERKVFILNRFSLDLFYLHRLQYFFCENALSHKSRNWSFMNSNYMFFQVNFLRKGKITEFTIEWLHALKQCVYSNYLFEKKFCCKNHIWMASFFHELKQHVYSSHSS